MLNFKTGVSPAVLFGISDKTRTGDNGGMTNWGPALVVLLGIAGGVLYSNSRITDLRDSMNKRFDDMNKRFDDLRDLLSSEVKRLEERIERMQSTRIK